MDAALAVFGDRTQAITNFKAINNFTYGIRNHDNRHFCRVPPPKGTVLIPFFKESFATWSRFNRWTEQAQQVILRHAEFDLLEISSRHSFPWKQQDHDACHREPGQNDQRNVGMKSRAEESHIASPLSTIRQCGQVRHGSQTETPMRTKQPCQAATLLP
jgi:hypothetical protein